MKSFKLYWNKMSAKFKQVLLNITPNIIYTSIFNEYLLFNLIFDLFIIIKIFYFFKFKYSNSCLHKKLFSNY